MKRFYYISLTIMFSLIIFYIFYNLLNQNTYNESTTENIQVVSKGRNDEEQWIVLSNNKKIYVEDFSLWTLIEENQKYTISYHLIEKTGVYKLTKIVPSDYKGQF